MKKTLVFLMAAALFTTAGIPVRAQFSQPGVATSDGALNKIFGTNLNFSADMNVEIKAAAQDNDMTMSGKIYFAKGSSRTEMDMTKMKGSSMPAHAADQMKAMGMDQMISISRPDTKTLYLIYPGLESYAKLTISKTTEGAGDTKIETAELGKETVDGHPCVKSKYTLHDAGQNLVITAWKATDLKDYPVKIQVETPQPVQGQKTPTITTLHFTNLNTVAPAASLFEPPVGYRVYTDVQAMVQTEMLKKMGGANGMPPNHP